MYKLQVSIYNQLYSNSAAESVKLLYVLHVSALMFQLFVRVSYSFQFVKM